MSRLRDCRERAGYSQKQVALILKVKAPSVSNWEKGKTRPTRDNLEKLDFYVRGICRVSMRSRIWSLPLYVRMVAQVSAPVLG